MITYSTSNRDRMLRASAKQSPSPSKGYMKPCTKHCDERFVKPADMVQDRSTIEEGSVMCQYIPRSKVSGVLSLPLSHIACAGSFDIHSGFHLSFLCPVIEENFQATLRFVVDRDCFKSWRSLSNAAPTRVYCVHLSCSGGNLASATGIWPTRALDRVA